MVSFRFIKFSGKYFKGLSTNSFGYYEETDKNCIEVEEISSIGSTIIPFHEVFSFINSAFNTLNFHRRFLIENGAIYDPLSSESEEIHCHTSSRVEIDSEIFKEFFFTKNGNYKDHIIIIFNDKIIIQGTKQLYIKYLK